MIRCSGWRALHQVGWQITHHVWLLHSDEQLAAVWNKAVLTSTHQHRSHLVDASNIPAAGNRQVHPSETSRQGTAHKIRPGLVHMCWAQQFLAQLMPLLLSLLTITAIYIHLRRNKLF
jgi:mannose/fructose/N-acetylgalactosamine-specific phosphotransferase system component IID